MRLDELRTRRVAVWGAGREGRAAWQALRDRFPDKPLALICPAIEAPIARGFVDAATEVFAGEPDLELLRRFEVVLKSPGISPYRSPALEAAQAGVLLLSATALWFAEHPQARTIGVTGSKGKSTTSAMIAHLLRAAGRHVVLAGNIGLPLLELPPGTTADWWVLELSSFQTRDLDAVPEIAVLLNLYPEHLDWHGSVETYYRDKLRLLGTDARRPRASVLNAQQAWPTAVLPHAGLHWFGDERGFHVAGDAIMRAQQRVLPLAELSLPGLHNALNLCAALAAVEAAGEDAVALAPSISQFHALPHRLQSLGVRGAIEWVDDSIATTPHATLAALAHYRGRDLVLLLGGHDRGVPWDEFARAIAHDPPLRIVTLGASGPRIAQTLAQHAILAGRLLAAQDLEQAVALARAASPDGGVVLLSPGSPSFGEFRDYIERGRRFAALAGFDPTRSSRIEGLGE